MATSYTVHREINLSCIQGVHVELQYAVPEGWTVKREADAFVVRGELADGAEDHVWRLVRFLAYADFLAFRQTGKTADEIRWEMVSSTAAGSGFRVDFILTRAG